MSRGPVIGALVAVGILTAAALFFWSPSTGPELSARGANAPVAADAAPEASAPATQARGRVKRNVPAAALGVPGAKGGGERPMGMGQRVRERYTEEGIAATAKAVEAFAIEAKWSDGLRSEVDDAIQKGQESGEQILASEHAGEITALEAGRQLMKLQVVEAGSLKDLLGEEQAHAFVVAVGIGGLNRRGVAGNRRGAGRAGRRPPGAPPVDVPAAP